MKILITGHRGFVGRYFLEKYKEHEITGIDIVDGNDVRDFFKQDSTTFDLVIHLAAVVGVRSNIENNPIDVAIDLAIDSDLFRWALKTRPGRIVYFSSSAAYPTMYQDGSFLSGMSENLIDLYSIKNPDLTYGWAKLSGEYLARFAVEQGIKVNIFRPFSGYGTDQSLEYPFPSFINRIKNKVDKFEIWGNGNQVRDWIHIRDIVDAVDKAIEMDSVGPINLGSGIPISFNNLAKMMMDISGHTVPIIHLHSEPSGVQYRLSDPSKMLSFYAPRISLEKGISMALKGTL